MERQHRPSARPALRLAGCALASLGMLSGATVAQAGGLGVGAGVVKLEGQDNKSLFFTGNLRFKFLGPIAIEPEVGYWKEEHEGVLAGTKSEDLNIGVNALLVIPGDSLQFFGGIGIGAHFLDRTESLGSVRHQLQRTKSAFQFLAGLEVRLSGQFNLFGVARRDVFRDDNPDEPHQTKFYAGLRLKF